MQCVVSSEISDSNSDEEDPDYVPRDESEISDNEYESEMELVEEGNVSTLSCNSIGHSCIKEILLKLQTLDNRHNWRSESIDTFIRKYLSCKKNIAKLFKYEMDIINEEVYKIFDKRLFKMTDSKIVRVKKIFVQLRKMLELLHFESSDKDGMQYFQPKKLFEIYKNFITSSKYPKEFLVAAVCNTNSIFVFNEWEEKSKIPIQIDVPFLQDTHIIFNYPEFSKERQQLEMRTFDYTHILNNLRYHICNRGFVGISTEAFKNVSKVNHDILPMTIVEDKLDRQNCKISQRFFSEEVQNILLLNGDNSEANFVEKTRNWFRACDERGMDVHDRIRYWNDMYSFLVSKCKICDYLPSTTHVQGIPVKTFEALLHTISTHFSLYSLASGNSYNTRAISTLAIESFFSDLA